jgi:hypothetical protein
VIPFDPLLDLLAGVSDPRRSYTEHAVAGGGVAGPAPGCNTAVAGPTRGVDGFDGAPPAPPGGGAGGGPQGRVFAREPAGHADCGSREEARSERSTHNKAFRQGKPVRRGRRLVCLVRGGNWLAIGCSHHRPIMAQA